LILTTCKAISRGRNNGLGAAVPTHKEAASTSARAAVRITAVLAGAASRAAPETTTVGVTGAATGILAAKGAKAIVIVLLAVTMKRANPGKGLIVKVITITETAARGATPTVGVTALTAAETEMTLGAAATLLRKIGVIATKTAEAAALTAKTAEAAAPTTETTVATAPTTATTAATTKTTAVAAPTNLTTKVGATTVDPFLKVQEEKTKVGIDLS
jgi:hypothetical protein